MISFPNGKINLGLNITGKRPDGFHNIKTVFYPIMIRDALEVLKVDKEQPLHEKGGNATFTPGGILIPGNTSDNLCLKAYERLKQDFPTISSVDIHLLKAIPIGAGLGGGSADGAFMLKTLNRLFSLGLTEQQLINYALEVGSDCPFFIINEPCLATGRGEELRKIKLDLSGYQLVLVNPGIHVNTAWAFSQLNKEQQSGNDSAENMDHVISSPVETWRYRLTNDFERPVFKQHPELRLIQDEFYKRGASYSSMSGSGSSVYAFFPGNVKPFTEFPPDYFVKQLYL